MDLNEGEVFARQAAALGIPPESIRVVQHDACYTMKEAHTLCRFLALHDLHHVILVTSDYHTRRARRIFRKASQRFGITVRIAAAPDSALDLSRWWQPRSGLVLLFIELLKTLYSSWELFKQAGRQPQAPSRLRR
jgi:uncharacterized SAM-binding protein YcdF (DUF218 family)